MMKADTAKERTSSKLPNISTCTHPSHTQTQTLHNTETKNWNTFKHPPPFQTHYSVQLPGSSTNNIILAVPSEGKFTN